MGCPLAIELAAARCGLLSADEIAERLQDALGALGSGARDAPARQQTLRATIDWSHALLSDAEKQCFARFAVFAGGATVDAAETITHAGLDTLDGLAAKSLLVRGQHAHTPTRLGMLETIRAYAGERLAARRRHRRRPRGPLSLLPRASPSATEPIARFGVPTPESTSPGWTPRSTTSMRLSDGRSPGRAPSRRSRCARRSAAYWLACEPLRRGGGLDRPGPGLPAADRPSRALRPPVVRQGHGLWRLGRGAEQPAVLAGAEAIARALGDPVTSLPSPAHPLLQEIEAERQDAADALADEALHLAKAAGDDWQIAEASRGKAIAAPSIAELRERVDRAAALLSDVGNVHQLANLLSDAAYAALCLGSDS